MKTVRKTVVTTSVAASSVVKRAPFVAGQKLGTAELLFRSAQDMGLRPNWVIPNGLFAVLVNDQEHYVNFARSPLNSHTSASLARDKYLTRRILERHHLPNIPFARPVSPADAASFLRQYGKIIAKPVSGSGAHDIRIITAVRQLQALDITKYILEKYIAGQELRYLVLNGTVIGVHRSSYGTSVKEDRPLQRISYHPSVWDAVLVSSAIQVARILGLRFAAVDYLIDASGQAYILEVNTAPGLKWFHAPTSGPPIDVARQFLEAIFKDSENDAGGIPIARQGSSRS